MYVLQISVVALLGSTVAAYKVLSVSEPKPKPPGAKSVVALMLLITSNGFRYFVADFYFSKIFDKDLDIGLLGGKTIVESMGVQIEEGPEDDDHGSGSYRMIVTPTQEIDSEDAEISASE